MDDTPTLYLPLTVSELASCLAWGKAQRRHDLYLRRLRHWTAAGILQPVGALYPGTGQSRQFDPEQVYHAAVLFKLADHGLSIGFIKAIADVLAQTLRRADQGELWEEAKGLASRRGHHVFLDLSAEFAAAVDKPVTIHIGLVRGDGRAHPSFVPEDLLRITIDLTELFAGVRLP
jgi:DNA-binding transcriptional MerR regulator